MKREALDFKWKIDDNFSDFSRQKVSKWANEKPKKFEREHANSDMYFCTLQPIRSCVER